MRKNRINSSRAHFVLIRKKNFDSHVITILSSKPKSELSKKHRDNLDHGIVNEPIAREKYLDILKFKIKRKVQIRETGLVIQPNLFWVAASPDGLVMDMDAGVGLIEIKCPKSKHSHSPSDLLADKNFYIRLNNDGLPELKPTHEYYTQIQMAMGLSGAFFCDFVVYISQGLIIIRTPYDHQHFVKTMKKINVFYKDFMLPHLCTDFNIN